MSLFHVRAHIAQRADALMLGLAGGQVKRIAEIRVQQGLPEQAGAGEVAHWAATVTRR